MNLSRRSFGWVRIPLFWLGLSSAQFFFPQMKPSSFLSRCRLIVVIHHAMHLSRTVSIYEAKFQLAAFVATFLIRASSFGKDLLRCDGPAWSSRTSPPGRCGAWTPAGTLSSLFLLCFCQDLGCVSVALCLLAPASASLLLVENTCWLTAPPLN